MTTEVKTSQSIYITLDTLTTETSVPGQSPKMQKHTLPRKAFPTSEEFENEELLLAWTEKNKVTHACLQKGIKAHLIDIRAKFKSCKKDDTWSNEYGQKNVNAYPWEVQTRPNSKQNEAKAAVLTAGMDMGTAMKAAGLTDELIRISLLPVYGKNDTEMILAKL